MTHLRPLGGEVAPEEALFEVADGGEEKEEEEGADQAADDGHDGCGGNHRFQDLQSEIDNLFFNLNIPQKLADLHRRKGEDGQHGGHQEARALVQRHGPPLSDWHFQIFTL